MNLSALQPSQAFLDALPDRRTCENCGVDCPSRNFGHFCGAGGGHRFNLATIHRGAAQTIRS